MKNYTLAIDDRVENGIEEIKRLKGCTGAVAVRASVKFMMLLIREMDDRGCVNLNGMDMMIY